MERVIFMLQISVSELKANADILWPEVNLNGRW
jgi:hypothetical protein